MAPMKLVKKVLIAFDIQAVSSDNGEALMVIWRGKSLCVRIVGDGISVSEKVDKPGEGFVWVTGTIAADEFKRRFDRA